MLLGGSGALQSAGLNLGFCTLCLPGNIPAPSWLLQAQSSCSCFIQLWYRSLLSQLWCLWGMLALLGTITSFVDPWTVNWALCDLGNVWPAQAALHSFRTSRRAPLSLPVAIAFGLKNWDLYRCWQGTEGVQARAQVGTGKGCCLGLVTVAQHRPSAPAEHLSLWNRVSTRCCHLRHGRE